MNARGRAAAAALALCALAAPAAADGIGAWRVALHPEDERVTSVGALEYRGGLELRADDPRFGGLSSLLVAPDGSWVLAASDRNVWVRIRLGYTPEGRLAGVLGGEIFPLARPAGQRFGDVESLAPAGPDILAAFEGEHAIALFSTEGPGRPAGRPRRIAAPDGIGAARPNRGIEAVAPLGPSLFLALAEELAAGPGAVRGWVGGPGRGWQPLAYAVSDGFVPTGAARAPSGEILVVERKFSWLGGLKARVVALDPATIRPGARLAGTELAMLEPPLSVDNFEGIAARRGPAGETLIYLVSDDNFNLLQRTLLLMFAWRPRAPG